MDVVSGISYQPVSFAGRIDEGDRLAQRYTLGDLAHDLADASGADAHRDMFPLSVIAPLSTESTAPSAGALYPMFLYYADDVALWRYEPRRHGLAKVVDGDVRAEIATAGLEQAPLKRAPGIIVVVAKPAISAAKYRGRAERYCIIEAGHIGQNILLTAEALGLGACPIGAFRDEEVLDVLGLGDDYLALYLIPVGIKFEP